ncbi:MAG: hypothetical protein UY39_C0020G0004 [Candidatus Kaiserbacteria bacterium GW2011_GWC2_49_12]|uniref:Uncharacterized protein n=1 Tax=Candidatus Kaiserbacteria bacterium GW2011_GWC2_49_12 TaxID=1618675 RepID=A0A0G1VLC8_9BACT|nr:MAG: hypothetical protein UY39_C0020G0004 [Candidatus Kaiserbacteria bacterium GW2011_GWC2_49_12]
MIRTLKLGMDTSRTHMWYKCFAYKKIIYTPSYIPFTGIREMAPPRVMTFALGKISKYIHKTSRDELIDALTFLFGIPMLAFVLFWIGEVLRRVRDVQIAAKK